MATELLDSGISRCVRSSASARRATLAWCGAAALCLLWPAAWNGYPIVFADTGTYLSQAIHGYAGWDRPVFYSLFMLPFHAHITLWPVIAAQALIAVYVLRVVCQVLLPAGLSVPILAPACVALAAGTWLPFLASELIPDLFTPLLVLLLSVLTWAPDRFSPLKRWLLVAMATFMVAAQQSNVPLAVAMVCILAPLSLWTRRLRVADLRHALMVPVFAMVAMSGVNLAAHHRMSISPYGSIFYLARLIADGPAVSEMQRDCPVQHWRLCPFLPRLPMDSDVFLWAADSPLQQAGGPKALAPDADAIIAAVLRAEPMEVIDTAAANTMLQLHRFSSGDGLEPWRDQVSPWLERDFPQSEQARFSGARQQNGELSVPPWLAQTHRIAALAGIAACVALLPLAARRRSVSFGFLLAVLLVIPIAAAITGALSGPHDRYQSRVMWLPPFVAGVCIIAETRRLIAAARRQAA
jgi:hypothetical protein